MRDEMAEWIDPCAPDDIDEEDLIRFDHEDRTFAIYRSPDDDFFCTDGLCTHEQVHLQDGLMIGYVIECLKHNSQFDYRTGEVTRAPACANLRTYPIKVEDNRIFIQV
jgi:3-phenylpropionate/trans-cinnamate dioxygenase ferredoxin subunit